jgi:urease alpha subunit
VVPQNFADEITKGRSAAKAELPHLLNAGGVAMEQAMSDLAAPDLMAACLSVMAPYDKAEVRAALHRDSLNRADPDFAWVALLGVRTQRWIIDNQDWKAPRVRHRRLL